EKALHARARHEVAGLRDAPLLGGLPLQLDVAAERHPGDPVVGPPAMEAADARPETDREDLDGHAQPLGDQVVPELVEQDHDAEHDSERQREFPDPAHVRQKPVQHSPPCDTISSATPRAHASASWTLASEVAGTGRCRSRTFSTTRGIPGKSSRPASNACTATSLTAFSAAGEVPPAFSAEYARSRQG